MEFTEVSMKDSHLFKRYGDLVDTQQMFLNSGFAAAELKFDGIYRDARIASNSMRAAIKQQGNQDKIKIVKRGNKVYMMRIEAT